MVLFPGVPSDGRPAIFRELRLLSSPAKGKEYTGLLADDSSDADLWLDTQLIGNQDSYNSILSSIAIAPKRKGYLTSNLSRGETIAGASIGLATCIELMYPGQYSQIAFTGFVTAVDSGAVTNIVHDVDCIREKVIGASQQNVRLIVPSQSIKSLGLGDTAVTPRDILRGEKPNSVIGSCLTVMEAVVVANCLASSSYFFLFVGVLGYMLPFGQDFFGLFLCFCVSRVESKGDKDGSKKRTYVEELNTFKRTWRIRSIRGIGYGVSST